MLSVTTCRRLALAGTCLAIGFFIASLYITLTWWSENIDRTVSFYATVIIGLIFDVLFAISGLAIFLANDNDVLEGGAWMLLHLGFMLLGLGFSVLIQVLSDKFILQPSNPLEGLYVVYQWFATIVWGGGGVVLVGIALYVLAFAGFEFICKPIAGCCGACYQMLYECVLPCGRCLKHSCGRCGSSCRATWGCHEVVDDEIL
jgi:hypothetical protein